MEKFDPNRLPAQQIWTDLDLAKWAGLAFIVGIFIGAVLTCH